MTHFLDIPQLIELGYQMVEQSDVFEVWKREIELTTGILITDNEISFDQSHHYPMLRQEGIRLVEHISEPSFDDSLLGVLNKHLYIAWKLNGERHSEHALWQETLNYLAKPAAIMVSTSLVSCNRAYRSQQESLAGLNKFEHKIDIDLPLTYMLSVWSDPIPSKEQLTRAYALSDREADIAQCMCQGLNNAHIAKLLGHSPSTTQTITKRLYQKLGISRQTELVSKILRGSASWI